MNPPYTTRPPHTPDTSWRPNPRFAPDEEEIVRAAAEKEGVSVPMFVRLATLRYARIVAAMGDVK